MTAGGVLAPAGVMIVDDDEGVRESLRDVVELMGCSAILVASAEDALEVLAQRLPCLIILDLLMPGMTGGEMLEVLRREPVLARLPVVISTSAPERAPPGMRVLPKPIDIGALCDWIRRACQCGR
jgi:CheY-like chemotaxis protein